MFVYVFCMFKIFITKEFRKLIPQLIFNQSNFSKIERKGHQTHQDSPAPCFYVNSPGNRLLHVGYTLNDYPSILFKSVHSFTILKLSEKTQMNKSLCPFMEWGCKLRCCCFCRSQLSVGLTDPRAAVVTDSRARTTQEAGWTLIHSQ